MNISKQRIAIAAGSTVSSKALAWSDGLWVATDVSDQYVARAVERAGLPLKFDEYSRFVVPSDGAALYAAAVIMEVLGPLRWTKFLPDNILRTFRETKNV